MRTSYPFTFSPMLYIFKNRPENHFNIYATAGFGLMASDITLYQDSRQERNQQFWGSAGTRGGGLNCALPVSRCSPTCVPSAC